MPALEHDERRSAGCLHRLSITPRTAGGRYPRRCECSTATRPLAVDFAVATVFRVGEAESFGRQFRARYAFAGATAEMDRSAPLEPDETVLLQGAMRLRGGGLISCPVVLRLTPPRLTMLAHHAFGADQISDLPRKSVRRIEVADGAIQVRWLPGPAASEHLTELTGWTGRPALAHGLREIGPVADTLLNWWGSSDAGSPATGPSPHRRP